MYATHEHQKDACYYCGKVGHWMKDCERKKRMVRGYTRQYMSDKWSPSHKKQMLARMSLFSLDCEELENLADLEPTAFDYYVLEEDWDEEPWFDSSDEEEREEDEREDDHEVEGSPDDHSEEQVDQE